MFKPLSHVIKTLYPIAIVSTYGFDIGEKISSLNKKLIAVHLRPSLLRRLGSESDGGYVIADIVSAEHCLISLGVGDDISFETELSNKLAWINLYDHSVSKLPTEIKNAKHYRIKIGPEKNSDEISIQQTIEKFDSKSPLILKIDIEGSEWLSLENLNDEYLQRFEMIVGEFHNFLKIGNNDFFLLVGRVFERLGRHYYLFNSHANNWGNSEYIEGRILPDVIEFSFIRKDLLGAKDFVFVNNKEDLNRPNNDGAPEISSHHFSI